MDNKDLPEKELLGLYKGLNIVAYLIFVTVLSIGSFNVMNDSSVATISNKYPTLLTPGSPAFGIWIVIMVGLGGFMIYQFFTKSDILKRIHFTLAIALLLSAGWVPSFIYERHVLTIFLAGGSLGLLIWARISSLYGVPTVYLMRAITYRTLFCCKFDCDKGSVERVNDNNPTAMERYDEWNQSIMERGHASEADEKEARYGGFHDIMQFLFIETPLAIYTAWSLVAFVLTILVSAQFYGGSTFDEYWAIIVIIALGLVSMVELVTLSNVMYTATINWALIWIAIEHMAVDRIYQSTITVIVATGALWTLILLLRVAHYFRREA